MAERPPTQRRSARTRPPATSVDGRVLQRHGLATRTRLLDAAIGALAEHGHHAVRVDDVVARAEVSHGTFYRYFADKEELLHALAERCADDAEVLVASLGTVEPGAEGVPALRAWLLEFLEYYRRHGVVIRHWTEDPVADPRLASLGRASFAAVSVTLRALLAQSAGPDADARTVELQAAALLAMIERFFYVLTSRDLGFDDDAVADTLARVVHRGFFAHA